MRLLAWGHAQHKNGCLLPPTSARQNKTGTEGRKARLAPSLRTIPVDLQKTGPASLPQSCRMRTEETADELKGLNGSVVLPYASGLLAEAPEGFQCQSLNTLLYPRCVKRKVVSGRQR